MRVQLLSDLRIANYKSVGQPIGVPFRPITILLGKNNSGKTAVGRLPLLILNYLSATTRDFPVTLPVSARGLSFGSAPADLVHRRDPHGGLQLGATFRGHDGTGFSADLGLRVTQSIERGRTATANLDQFEEFGTAHPSETGQLTFPHYDATISDLPLSSLMGWMHLVANRQEPAGVFERRPPEDLLDPRGAAAPLLLAQDDELMSAVSRWYADNLSADLVLTQEGRASVLEVSTNGSSSSLAQAGQGYRQVLPVITYLGVLSRATTYGIRALSVEEPELHLHPAAHGAIMDAIVSAVEASKGAQVIVETHSENVVLRLRKHVAAGRLSPEEISILWFENSESGTSVRSIGLDAGGNVSEWPAGVFSEDVEEVRAILRTQRAD